MLKHTKKIKKMYEDIQKSLFSMIPEAWDKLYLYASVIDMPEGNTTGELYFYYIPKGILKKKPINVYEIPNRFNIKEEEYLKIIKNLYEYIKAIRSEFKKSQIKDIWSNLTITIKDSKFKVEYNFDDLLDNDFDSYERHIIWRYKYLGIGEEQLPRKDKKIIERYINRPNMIGKDETFETGLYINEVRHNLIYDTNNEDK